MEGWVIGKSKVFLKYYNEEYLARLYEIQVKKIVKIQSMMRSFLIKRRMSKKQNQKTHKPISKEASTELTEEEAAVILQKGTPKIYFHINCLLRNCFSCRKPGNRQRNERFRSRAVMIYFTIDYLL